MLKLSPSQSFTQLQPLSKATQPRQNLTPATLATDCLPALRSFRLELGDLPIKLVDDDHALLHGRGTAFLNCPASDAVSLGLSTTPFRVDLLA